MRFLYLSVLSLFLWSCSCVKSITQQEKDKKAITAVLKKQEKAWSSNHIDEYMKGYWASDSLKFYGSSGLTKGWQKTLDNYKKAYPTKAHTGTLHFTISDISAISKKAYWVLGRYHLKRTKTNADGIFMLVVKKINGQWKIVADTSCE